MVQTSESLPINERATQYAKTKEFIRRTARIHGFTQETLHDPEERINILKSFSAEQFLDLLSVTNSKLRGDYKRWERHYQRKAPRAAVKSGLQDSYEFEPPDHPEKNFTAFFNKMKERVNKDNLDVEATKNYAAIIFSHIFRNGNGRLARNAFSLMTTGELAVQQLSSERPWIVENMCEAINISAVEDMLLKANCTRFKWNEVGGLQNSMYYQAEDNLDLGWESESGLTARLKYLAAKKSGILAPRAAALNISEDAISQCYANGETIGFNQENSVVSGEDELWIAQWKWTPEEKIRFKEEYGKVKDEWFDETQRIIEKNPQIYSYWLKIGLNFPNPFGLRLPEFTGVLRAISQNEEDQQIKVVLNNNRYIKLKDDAEKESFIHSTRFVLTQKPELAALISTPPIAG